MQPNSVRLPETMRSIAGLASSNLFGGKRMVPMIRSTGFPFSTRPTDTATCA
ncbi:hypothetical protein [Mesorhizobium sp. M0239]|uniref:hypothetical protein n=1 Tax=unclassified Mesorhizobium TaxID=325217 RepID=UPI00333A4186